MSDKMPPDDNGNDLYQDPYDDQVSYGESFDEEQVEVDSPSLDTVDSSFIIPRNKVVAGILK